MKKIVNLSMFFIFSFLCFFGAWYMFKYAPFEQKVHLFGALLLLFVGGIVLFGVAVFKIIVIADNWINPKNGGGDV